jgi:hypothetical protein
MTVEGQVVQQANTLPWTHHLKLIVEFIVTFSLASFCVAIFFTHLGFGGDWLLPGILMIGLYLFVIGVCMYKLIRYLPIALLMLMIPLIPLLPMILVLVFIPLIQKL